ncbi:hypothetical protein EMEDMD4_790397 [Sinorhizobium medicae]|uniref:Uncharacterized protein n=1 Tax=Sinorhizobium medicae TaxID=110321 RepID=A0A508XAU8_9HYPH|nr:hypothetical protein EMEDMD4_790397 [Sinorhizobium medicae]
MNMVERHSANSFFMAAMAWYNFSSLQRL